MDNNDFNSHAHVERDMVFDVELENEKISTHTLTWSVTNAGSDGIKDLKHFNSHAHVERDCENGQRKAI